jgi:hypothetical protein
MYRFSKLSLAMLCGGAALYFSTISGLDANFLLKQGLIILPLQLLVIGYVIWFHFKQQDRTRE